MGSPLLILCGSKFHGPPRNYYSIGLSHTHPPFEDSLERGIEDAQLREFRHSEVAEGVSGFGGFTQFFSFRLIILHLLYLEYSSAHFPPPLPLVLVVTAVNAVRRDTLLVCRDRTCCV
jgi:hypothetical protein